MLRTIKTGLPHRWQVAVRIAVSMDDDGSIPALTYARDEMHLTGSSAAVGVCYPASEWPQHCDDCDCELCESSIAEAFDRSIQPLPRW